jgi:hemerythrin-like domain-containing protein
LTQVKALAALGTSLLVMIEPIAFWHAEHVYFGHLLELLRRQLDLFHRGERPNYQLMLDILSYLRDYSDEFHHPREDEAFARLAAHCPDMKVALARLEQEHRVIARTGEVLHGQLTAILEDAIVRREDVEAALATYLVYYGNHIAKEEEDIVGRAAQLLDAGDWEAVRTAVPAEPDPLFGGGSGERYRALRHQIALES